MPAPVAWTRLYQHGVGPTHPATPETVTNVLRSMAEAAGGDVPFRVRFDLDDGTSLVAKPKGRPVRAASSAPVHSMGEGV